MFILVYFSIAGRIITILHRNIPEHGYELVVEDFDSVCNKEENKVRETSQNLSRLMIHH